jgi:hypothetical protein
VETIRCEQDAGFLTLPRVVQIETTVLQRANNYSRGRNSQKVDSPGDMFSYILAPYTSEGNGGGGGGGAASGGTSGVFMGRRAGGS